MRRPYRRYLKIVAAAVTIGLAVVGVFNAVIDPFGAYRIIEVPALGDYKAEAGGRIGKAETIRRSAWDVIVLGSSRAQVGVDPYDELWAGSVVANAALGGTNLQETVQVLQYSLQVSRPRRVILLMDFVLMDDNQVGHPTFSQSRTVASTTVRAPALRKDSIT